jgi:hypothetical protein
VLRNLFAMINQQGRDKSEGSSAQTRNSLRVGPIFPTTEGLVTEKHCTEFNPAWKASQDSVPEPTPPLQLLTNSERKNNKLPFHKVN